MNGYRPLLLGLCAGLLLQGFGASCREQQAATRPEAPGVLRSWTGTASGIAARRAVLVAEAGAWEGLWERHAPGEEAPAVDFDEEMVLAVFEGPSQNRRGVLAEDVLWGGGTAEQGADPPALLVRCRPDVGGAEGQGRHSTAFGLFVLPRRSGPLHLEWDVLGVEGVPPRWRREASFQGPEGAPRWPAAPGVQGARTGIRLERGPRPVAQEARHLVLRGAEEVRGVWSEAGLEGDPPAAAGTTAAVLGPVTMNTRGIRVQEIWHGPGRLVLRYLNDVEVTRSHAAFALPYGFFAAPAAGGTEVVFEARSLYRRDLGAGGMALRGAGDPLLFEEQARVRVGDGR